MVDLAREGGDWITQPTSWIGSSSLVVVNAREGDTRWRLRFVETPDPSSRGELAPAVEGRFVARIGERARQTVVVAP